MSSSSLSMATANSASYTLCSSISHSNSSNIFFNSLHFSTIHFSSKTIPKSLTYRTQYLPVSSPFASSSLSRAFVADFDNLVVDEEDEFNEITEEEDDDEDEYFSSDLDEEDEENEEENQNQTQLKGSGRLYVGNLPYSLTSNQLIELFGEAGGVDSVEVVYDRVTDRSRGFAFVTMNSVDDAKEAIRMFDGALVGGRTVKVNFPEVPKGGEREVMGPKIRNSYRGFVDTPHKIYAGNLGWSVTSEDLKDIFSSRPGFLSAKVIYMKDSGKSRGFGFVSFASAEEVESSLKNMNGVEIEGRPLRLNLASERANPVPSLAIERRVSENSEMISSIDI